MGANRFWFGRHLCEVDGDLLVFRYDGPVSEADAKQMIQEIERLSFPPYGFFSISDLRRAGPSRPEARKLLALFSAAHPSPAAVCFGMQPMLRGVLTLTAGLLRAMKAKNPSPVILGTEQEARRWVDEQRAKLQSLAS